MSTQGDQAGASRSQGGASRVSTTLAYTPSDATSSHQLELVIVEPHRTDVLPLTSSGKLRVGRVESDIYLQDAAVSREHAVLHVQLPYVSIENLTATNPTLVQGRELGVGEAADLVEGDTAVLGRTVLLLRRARPRTKGLIWGHAYFVARLTEACARAPARLPQAFGVLRLQLKSAKAAYELLDVLPPGSVLASYAGAQFEAMVFGLASTDPETVTEALKQSLGQQLGSLGVAVFPNDGATADALTSVASDRLRHRSGRRASARPTSRSPRLQEIYERARKIAVAPGRRLLITGESGSGKAVLAEYIHHTSTRADKPLLTLNCAAIPRELAESMLFGHVKGAFSGATSDQLGYLRRAHGGTLVLDEIGELPLEVQSKLLTALSKDTVVCVEPVGDTRTYEVDVRVIGATNADVARAAKQGTFRADLYYRINALSLALPPLRACPEDILPLARALVDEFAAMANKPAPTLSEATEDLLSAYAWPGNFRELRNIIERGVTLCAGTTIEPEDLELVEFESPAGTEATEAAAELGRRALDGLSPEQARQAIGAALLQAGCHKAKAAAALGVRRQWLLKKMDELGMPRPRTGS